MRSGADGTIGTADDGRSSRATRMRPSTSPTPCAPATPSSTTSPTPRAPRNAQTGALLTPDADGVAGGPTSATPATYDNELLDAHYIAGDGRVNENIGLTTVHHVFHSEHNRLVDHTKAVLCLASGRRRRSSTSGC
ncbi:MAG: hypothetical protein M0C28_31895 [Candidatus Moduliflexus flocculans]|nr:hypothetical protein [Candidatus Moduliflexus flocculans]